MAAAVVTFAQPTGIRGHSEGNKKIRYFDVTADTGDYAATGFTKTAASLGYKRIAFVQVGSAATSGTDGATAHVIGVKYESNNTVLRFQLYDSGAENAPVAEKGAEAYPANFTFRIRVEGF